MSIYEMYYMQYIYIIYNEAEAKFVFIFELKH